LHLDNNDSVVLVILVAAVIIMRHVPVEAYRWRVSAGKLLKVLLLLYEAWVIFKM